MSEERLARIEGILAVQGELLAKQGEQLARQGEQLAKQDQQFARQDEQLIAIRATLGRLEPMIIKIMESQARLEGRVEGMPSARDFGHLEGRIDEISARQPTTLAYQSPKPRRSVEPS
ncbi:MAG: hypothetical protein WCF85_00080 [Rhodospirillaceae bacterium]